MAMQRWARSILPGLRKAGNAGNNGRSKKAAVGGVRDRKTDVIGATVNRELRRPARYESIMEDLIERKAKAPNVVVPA